MGEVVVSSEEGMVMEVEKEMKEVEKKKESKEGSSSMVRWENFLPKMGLRILLVEADDSTRQIIGALLRKCSYKVASVQDGLKAWEVLKARPHNIDLILTEAELPSISGYALLTLIMEHEICKNIPVIMMSAHDSVSMVYKCMLRGAADFLVKPIRINELKNLWQHVWRRQSQLSRGGGLGPQDESVAQEKLEATAENNATSDHSSGSKASAPRQEECIKKGSDAQSSCGKPDLEAESGYMAEVEAYSQPKQLISPVSNFKSQEHPNFAISSQDLFTPESAVAGSDTAAYNGNDQDQRVEQQSQKESLNLYTAANKRGVLANSSREAIDFIGALDNHSKHNSCSNDGANRLESSPQLDLSLRRFLPGVLDNKTSNEKQMLNHSNASAFTRYVNKTLHTFNQNPTSGSTPQDNKVTSGDHLCDNAPDTNLNAKDPMLPYHRKVISLPISLSKEVENEYRNASQKLFPIPLPVKGIRVDVSPVVRTPSPSPSPSSANQHQINSYHQFSVEAINGRRQFHPFDQSSRMSSNQPISKQDQQLECFEDRAHFSAADQSGSSSLCNETGGCLNGGAGGGGSSEGELNRQRSMIREAALTKFRLKRKERCYEKKVRYESRKKLAEQRPRVKGQFVRQVPPDPPPPKSDNSGGTTVVN